MYCYTQAIIEEMITILYYSFYHANSRISDKKAYVFENWYSGYPNWVIAIFAFRMGINHLYICLVVYLRTLSSLIDFVQEASHLGYN